jgi:hypothetical protein
MRADGSKMVPVTRSNPYDDAAVSTESIFRCARRRADHRRLQRAGQAEGDAPRGRDRPNGGADVVHGGRGRDRICGRDRLIQ